MKYEEALKLWGATKLLEYHGKIKIEDINLETIKVEFEFNQGWVCCNGSDPSCYCSFAESPSANVVITGKRENVEARHQDLQCTIDSHSFDFKEILREICEVADGNLSL